MLLFLEKNIQIYYCDRLSSVMVIYIYYLPSRQSDVPCSNKKYDTQICQFIDLFFFTLSKQYRSVK
jgi:hypothetical protein